MVYTKTTKNTKARSVLDIALCKSNDNGCYHFIYLYTGKIIDGYKWHKLTIYDEVIDRV